MEKNDDLKKQLVKQKQASIGPIFVETECNCATSCYHNSLKLSVIDRENECQNFECNCKYLNVDELPPVNDVDEIRYKIACLIHASIIKPNRKHHGFPRGVDIYSNKLCLLECLIHSMKYGASITEIQNGFTRLVNNQFSWLSCSDVKQIVEASVASGRFDVLEFLFIHKRLPIELLLNCIVLLPPISNDVMM
jgi:hypothetical protein